MPTLDRKGFAIKLYAVPCALFEPEMMPQGVDWSRAEMLTDEPNLSDLKPMQPVYRNGELHVLMLASDQDIKQLRKRKP